VADVDRAAVLGGQVGGVEDVLHAERHAMQQSTRRARVKHTCLAPGELEVHRLPGAKLPVTLHYVVKGSLDLVDELHGR
jgi:hypothetical protein